MSGLQIMASSKCGFLFSSYSHIPVAAQIPKSRIVLDGKELSQERNPHHVAAHVAIPAPADLMERPMSGCLAKYPGSYGLTRSSIQETHKTVHKSANTINFICFPC